MKNLISSILVIASATSATAQVPLIMQQLNDSTSHITVIQPDALEARLMEIETSDAPETETNNGTETESTTPTRQGGYRVQVFSDNNQRTAKNEARYKARMIAEAFPEYATYVVFQSPFWRLKVGDFRTQAEADDAANAIRSHFPSFAREVRVVKDRINR